MNSAANHVECTHLRAVGRDGCPACRRAARWRETAGVVPAGPVRDHLDTLRRAGLSLAHVAALTGLGMATVNRLRAGRNATVLATTADAILAVPLPAVAQLAPNDVVDATGTRRRVQGLMRAGHPVARIAASAGVHYTILGDVLAGSTLVTARTHLGVARTYDELWDARPDTSTPQRANASRHAQARAEVAGWPMPAAWDDDDIDDPDASPAEAPDAVVPGRFVLDLDEWVFLVRGGENSDRAAARCGVTPAAVERAAHRARRADVLALLAATHLAAA